MCYFLYCCINKEANDDLFRGICKKYGYAKDPIPEKGFMLFDPGVKGGVYFPITGNMCDCGTSLGAGDAKTEEIQDYLSWLKELRKCRSHGMEAFYIMKFWEGSDHADEMKPIVTINIEDVDAEFLAGIQEDTVYRIEYFKRYGKEYENM